MKLQLVLLDEAVDEENGSIELILEQNNVDYYTIRMENKKATVVVMDNDETPVISIVNPSNGGISQ